MKFKSLLFSFFLLSISWQISAQVQNKEVLVHLLQKLDSVKPETIRTGFFLNKGFLLGQFMDKMKDSSSNISEPKIFFMSTLEWNSFYIGLVKSSLGKEKIKVDAQAVIEKYRSRNDKVAFGLAFAQGEWLQPWEIDENLKTASSGRTDSKKYETITLVGASPMQEEIVGRNVRFEFPDELFIVKSKDVKIEIDFTDGNGFREVKKGSIVDVAYEGQGEKSIVVRYTKGKKIYLVYSKILISVLDETEPDFVFELGNEEMASGRIESLPGGQAWLYNGCDKIFDKPVIFVEGFDPLNSVSISNIHTRYLFVENLLKASGYDVIYLSFADGGASIQTNAAVLQQLLGDVKSKKTGSYPIAVIGESMGGLVARYCLRTMEMNNVIHGVDKFISLDSPFLGANMPVGYQKLIEDLNDVDLINIFNIAQGDLNDAITTLNAPASKQMLLRYKGQDPHSDFTTLQNTFSQIGFPNQNNIKNIALVNGSNNGTAQSPIGSFSPGDMLFKFEAFSGILNAIIKIRTNDLNSSTTVSSAWILVGGVPTTIKDRTYSFNGFNYDVVPGGKMSTDEYGVDEIIDGWAYFNKVVRGLFIYSNLTSYGRDDFSFVPLFSSISSTAPQTTQSHLNRSISEYQTNSWTPFQSIYSTPDNTTHILSIRDNDPTRTLWVNLFNSEFGTTSSFCDQIAAPPPTPNFNSTQWYMCPNQSLSFSVTNGSAIDNLYFHNWQVTGPNNFLYGTSGTDQIFLSGLAPGAYTITLIRTYSGGVYSNISTSRSRVLNVYPSTDPNCSGGGGGGPIQRISPSQVQNQIQTEIKDKIRLGMDTENKKERMHFWPNPASLNLTVSLEADKPVSYLISLVEIHSNVGTRIILGEGRMEDSYLELVFDTSKLKPGVYILEIQTEMNVFRERVIIK